MTSPQYSCVVKIFLIVVNSHPGLTDLFLSQARKAHTQEQQKSSVRDKLKKQPETTSPKLSAKSKGQER